MERVESLWPWEPQHWTLIRNNQSGKNMSPFCVHSRFPPDPSCLHCGSNSIQKRIQSWVQDVCHSRTFSPRCVHHSCTVLKDLRAQNTDQTIQTFFFSFLLRIRKRIRWKNQENKWKWRVCFRFVFQTTVYPILQFAVQTTPEDDKFLSHPASYLPSDFHCALRWNNVDELE